MKLSVVFGAGMVLSSAGAVSAQVPDTPYSLNPPFVIEAAKTLPAGDQTTKGGFGKAAILGQSFVARTWAVPTQDASILQMVNSYDLKAGTPLTGLKVDGQMFYCAFPTKKFDFTNGKSFFYYVKAPEGAQLCLSDEDGDGVFDHKRHMLQSSQVYGTVWDYNQFDAVKPLEAPVPYKLDDEPSRPYGQLNAFLLKVPFTKAYSLCLQELTIGGADTTVGCQNEVPVTPDGPVTLAIGKLKVAVKSFKGGVFTYEILSGFDGEAYPGYK